MSGGIVACLRPSWLKWAVDNIAPVVALGVASWSSVMVTAYLCSNKDTVVSRSIIGLVHRCQDRFFHGRKPKRIILVRHGESAGNVDEKSYSATPDNQIPLTEKGREQARMVCDNTLSIQDGAATVECRKTVNLRRRMITHLLTLTHVHVSMTDWLAIGGGFMLVEIIAFLAWSVVGRSLVGLWRETGRYGGTQVGTELAKIIGDETCAIYHSPLLRTVQTKDEILKAFDPVRICLQLFLSVSGLPFVLVL